MESKKLPSSLERMREVIGKHGVTVLALGNTCLLTGYLMSDPAWLRAGCATGSTLGILFNVTRSPPIWPNVGWGLVFVVANTGMLLRIVLEDVGISFSDDEMSMYESQFMQNNVSLQQFKSLLALGEWREAVAGDVLCVEGQRMDEVPLTPTAVTRTVTPTPRAVTGTVTPTPNRRCSWCIKERSM